MAPSGKVIVFYREGNDWFCNAGLPSDITIAVDGANFHLHKFPLMSKCGKIAKIIEESQSAHEGTFTMTLEGFPGGPDTFLLAAKFCYGVRIEFTARNIIMVYCAADYLEMTDEYGEDNLHSRSESFFHKNVLRNWKDCILALQSSEPVITKAEELQIISKCLSAVSMMVCTDPSLFGWPMMMYGSLQSPGGSILWNGINTGARIRSSESDWWFEDISYLSVHLFQKLIQTMVARGIRPENLAGAIMYYAKKYLPGLSRWQGGQSTKTRTVTSFSMTPAAVDQRVLLESIAKLLPEKKGKSFCRFLLGLLRVALILGVNDTCQDSLEKRIGMQLELATLDSLLIPSYSDSDTLYNTDSVERIIRHFTSVEPSVTSFSPASFDLETSPSFGPLKKVARLIDSYMAEVASDVNLKPGKIRALAEALPESSRSLHDGLYRALDIYFKGHPWLQEKEKEQLCNIIDFQKLSIDACAHASQNERLPLRVILQVLFFEQLHLRTALAGCLHVLDADTAPTGPTNIPTDMAGQIIQRDGWVSVVRENQVLKVDMENMRSRVGELEEEFSKIKQEMKRVTKSHSSLSSPRFVAQRMGCKRIPRSSDAQLDVIESTGPTPRPSDVGSTSRPSDVGSTPRSSVEQARPSHHSRHRKSFSLL
ncbi:BTB/POZ domain-containing protein At3g44820 [Camellia sinensis]|uniref:BTB/POZ domain-containing protein At3g44820 n=1 Tax=Camellia sinensis TaxID=4442 RepID=UPI001036AD3B|nr:BTB/POZ domain-containing protein At3g44820 [Camellia sinensis]